MINNIDTKDGSTLEALWCVDSESGNEYLLEIKTGKKLLKRVNGIIMEVK